MAKAAAHVAGGSVIHPAAGDGEVNARSTERPLVLTFEGGLYLAAIAVAAFLRVIAIGALPLSPAEAALAISSWAVTHGPVPLTWAAPAYQTLTAWLLWLFGGDDVVARLVPVLAGIGAVALLWPLRPVIGRPAALLAAWLLALSPLLTFFSRQAGGETLAIATALGLTAVVFRAGPRPSPFLAGLAGGLFAVLALSGPLGVSLAIAFVVFLAVTSLAREQFAVVWQPVDAAARDLRSLTAAVASFVLALVVLSTAGFFYLGGFGWTSLAAWVNTFDFSGATVPFWFQWLELLMAEPAITLLGLAGAGVLVRNLVTGRGLPAGQSGALAVWLLIWAGFGLLVAGLAPGPAADQALVPLIPLALLAATWLAGWPAANGATEGGLLTWGGEAGNLVGRNLVVVALLVFFEVILLARLTNEPAATGNWALWALFWAGLLLIVGLVLSPWFLEPETGGRAAATVALVLLLALTLPAAVRLGVRLDAAELPAGTRTSPDIQRFLQNVRLAAGHPESGQARSITVDESLRLPLAWYLKDYPAVRFGEPTDPPTGLVIRPGGPAAPGQINSLAREAELFETWTPEFPNLAAFARWLVLDRPPAAPLSQKVILDVNP